MAGLRPAGAQSSAQGDPDDPPGLECLGEATGTLGISPAVVNPGQTVTLSWSVQAPAGCGALRVTVDSLSAGRSGTRVVDPIATRSYQLRVGFGGGSRQLASKVAAVQLPTGPTGHPTVTLTRNDQAPLLVQALATPDARVFVQNQVSLDLTGYHDINLATGVQLIGGRTSREPGPLLFVPCEASRLWYCQSAPRVLFLINGAAARNVRVTGVRIAGPDQQRADKGVQTFGIRVEGAVGVEIDNNELSGWRGAAVDVRDRFFDPATQPAGRICHEKDPTCATPNARTVRIHDNFFHHNQREGGDGYGINVAEGAYALVERNVFDWNRHAIASDGHPGTGYLAYRNLVLEHGGFHNEYGPYDAYTHQFDMHGTQTCDEFLWIDSEWNCGDAGQYVDIRFNSFFYTNDNAFKLRGHPEFDSDVVSNVFANLTLTAIPAGPDGALGGYTEHINAVDNRTAMNELDHRGLCDFDRDFIADEFLATGETWWFRSGAGEAPHWRFLNTSKARLDGVQLGDVDGDGRCDVVADGVVSSGGTGPAFKRIAELVVKAADGSLASWHMDGAIVSAQHVIGTALASWQLAALADVNGDGEADLVWRDERGQATIWAMSHGVRLGETSEDAAGLAFQGSGDFDADGSDDLLWRDEAGQLAIWFAGQRHDATPVDGNGRRTAYPGYENVPAPVDLDWSVQGVGDLDGDGRADILWRHATGALWVWRMDGGLRIGETRAEGLAGAAIHAVADLDGDGRADILWRDRAGSLSIWFGGDPAAAAGLSFRAGVVTPADPHWIVADVRDFDGDGRADLLWQDANRRLVLWRVAGTRVVREEALRQSLGDGTLATQPPISR